MMLNGFGLCHRIIYCNQSLNGLIPILMNLVMVPILALSSNPKSMMLKQTNPLQAKEKPFVSSAPLFLLKQPVDVQNPYIDICECIGNPYFPRWEENGKNHYVCILSCFGPPLHTCDTAACKKRWYKKMVRHHIDPTKHQWKSKRGAFWKPFVEWLWDERVKQHFLLSEEFKQLIPSESW